MYKYKLEAAKAGLDANKHVVARIAKTGPKGQYNAVGSALARQVAKKATCTEHEAKWAIVNAYNRYFSVNDEEDEEINDF